MLIIDNAQHSHVIICVVMLKAKDCKKNFRAAKAIIPKYTREYAIFVMLNLYYSNTQWRMIIMISIDTNRHVTLREPVWEISYTNNSIVYNKTLYDSQ